MNSKDNEQMLGRTVIDAIRIFAGGNRGATMIEYALIVALIAVVIAVSLGAMGVATQDMYSRIANAPFTSG